MLLKVILLPIFFFFLNHFYNDHISFLFFPSQALPLTSIWNLNPFSRSTFGFKMLLFHPQQPLPPPEWLRRRRLKQRACSQEVDVHSGFCITIMSLSWFSIFISIKPHSCSAMISSWLGMSSCCIAFFFSFFFCGWAPGFTLTLPITDVFRSNFSVLNITCFGY